MKSSLRTAMFRVGTKRSGEVSARRQYDHIDSVWQKFTLICLCMKWTTNDGKLHKIYNGRITCLVPDTTVLVERTYAQIVTAEINLHCILKPIIKGLLAGPPKEAPIQGEELRDIIDGLAAVDPYVTILHFARSRQIPQPYLKRFIYTVHLYLLALWTDCSNGGWNWRSDIPLYHKADSFSRSERTWNV